MRNCFALLLVMLVTAFAVAEEPVTGVLDYQDGNRATGKLISPGVFQSDRFGEIRFDPTVVKFIPDAEIAPAIEESKVRAGASDLREPASPVVPKRRFDPWKFSVAGFLDRRREGSVQESTYDFSMKAERPRQDGNRLLATLSYHYVQKNDLLDTRRATAKGEWDHDLSKRWLFLYRPEFEYDGRNLSAADAATLGRARLNYGLMQQSVGLGYRIIDTKNYKTSISANWAYLYLHVFHYGGLNLDAPVFSLDNDFTFPWKLTLKHNARAYFVSIEGGTSFSSDLELKKQVTDLFYLAVRHEYRMNLIAGANEIDRIRFFFGLDF